MTVTYISGLAKATDPATSHAAAKLDTSHLLELVFMAIRAYGDKGCISEELETALSQCGGIDSISPRYAQLEARGMISRLGDTRTASSGRQQLVMRALPPPFLPPTKKISKAVRLARRVAQLEQALKEAGLPVPE